MDGFDWGQMEDFETALLWFLLCYDDDENEDSERGND